MRKHRLHTAEEIRKLVEFDPETGIFRRKAVPLSASYVKRYGVKVRQNAGDAIGYVRADGYIEVSVGGNLYHAHRLAWLYMTGKWPSQQIDHIDTVRGNNAIANLREATPRENQANRKVGKSSRTGIKCVTKTAHGWGAYIVNGRKFRWLGTFETSEQASAAYETAARELCGEFARAA